jgi:hypothetical protein
MSSVGGSAGRNTSPLDLIRTLQQSAGGGIYNLRDRPGEHLNKITIGEIKKLVKYSAFDRSEITLLPYRSKNRIFSLLSASRHVPVIQEMIHSGIVVRLDKAETRSTGGH